MSILPLPTSRVSDYLGRTRLVQQTQSDQLALFRLQNQISTGRRIFAPSDDGPSALRAITLQRNLERQDQLLVNLRSAQASLTSADGSLNEVATILNNVRADALAVAGTTATDQQRLTTRTDVLESLDRLVSFANSTYQDTFLFAGSRALSAPYVFTGSYVEYRGDEANQQRHVDAGVLFDTNIPGDSVFGGLSEPVLGTADLDVQVNASTRLSDLNSGNGVTAGGSIEIAYFTFGSVAEAESTVVDLSGARTLGDVARLIEANGPPPAQLRVSVSGDGLQIQTQPDAVNPGSIVVREVAAGETAAELGIVTSTPASSVTGADLDPTIRPTTALADLLGTRSTGRLSLAGTDNDLTLTADANGDLNGLSVTIQDGAVLGSETAAFAAGPPPALTLTIAEGVTTATQLAAVINNESTVPFSAQVDFRDSTSATLAGGGQIAAANLTNVTAGGGGTSLDLASGLQITNGGDPFTIDTSTAETVEDLLNLLNAEENGLFAELNAAGTGINVRTRRSGADFAIGEGAPGGQLATQLGIRTFTGASRLEDFNRGAGVVTADERELTLALDDGNGVVTNVSVELGEIVNGALVVNVRTVDELIAAINTQTGGVVTASLASSGNGITLTSTDPLVTGVASTGTASLAGDTLQFEAAATGVAGDQAFTLEVVNTASGALATSVAGGVITVDLGGTTPNTAAIAASIDAQLPGYNVTAQSGAATAGPGDVNTPGAAFSTTGGVDASAAGDGTITVTGGVAERLGFFSAGADPPQAVSVGGVLTSDDRNTIEVDSVFNSLLRLAEALTGGVDAAPQVGAAIERLDDDLDRATAARGEIGSRLQSLNSLQFRLEDEEVELRSTLSEELDVDLTQAISDFTARQFAMQASLQTTASLLQLSILNFI